MTISTMQDRSLETQRILERHYQYALPGGPQISDIAEIVVDRAENAYLWDTEGNRYIDFFTGVGVCNIGHSHPKHQEVLAKQLSQFSVGSFHTKVRAKLYETLAGLLPPTLNQFHMYSTGSEAVEAAVRFARSATGREEVISFWGGFHGKTQGAIALHAGPRRGDVGPLPTGVHHVPYANCYRCPVDLEFPKCQYGCVSLAKKSIAQCTSGKIAAIIVEPAQGTNGNIIPPPGYLKEMRKLADDLGALLILDEVITGFGRTGRLFAFEHEDVIPDILVLGKAMGSGVPVSAIVSSANLVKDTPFAFPSAASSTFGGNPIACAAALGTLEIIRDESLVANCSRLSKIAEDIMGPWIKNIDIVGNVGILGLMIGVELVVPGTKRPLPSQLTKQLFSSLLKRGLMAMAYGSRIRLYPPLTISDSDLREGLLTLENELKLMSKSMDEY